MRGLIVGAAVFLTIAVFDPRAASADPITITSGEAVVSSPGGTFLVRMILNGDNFQAAINWQLGFVLPQTVCPAGCHPGDVLSLNTVVFHSGPINVGGLDNDTVGSATINGVSYPNLAFAGSLTFAGPTVTLPPASQATSITLTGPFTLNGTILGYPVLAGEPLLAFTADITGRGTTTAAMIQNPISQSYSFGTLRYDFTTEAPVPEPITGLLVGGGLALGWVGRRRRQKPRVA